MKPPQKLKRNDFESSWVGEHVGIWESGISGKVMEAPCNFPTYASLLSVPELITED